ncbi:MAG: chitosanase [Prosthecochloris sp.]|nr:chitosanase [Prosthecochloris sp.]
MSKILIRRANRSAGYSYVCGHLVEILQHSLQEKGFPVGRIDGVYGMDTEAAIKGWQSETGLAVSGAVTDDDWRTLTGQEPPEVFERALQITATFEGHGFRKAAGNFDGAWLTWGIIGYTLRHGEIQKIVKAADEVDPSIIDTSFGPLADTLREVMSKSSRYQEQWADRISVGVNKYGIEPPWRDAFSRFGSHSEVQRLQVKRARDKYWKRAEADSTELGLKSDLGRALCFDIAVQNGGVSSREASIFRERITRKGSFDEAVRREVLAETIADTSLSRWREDVLSRKMTLATGSGKVHGVRFSTGDWGLGDEVTREAQVKVATVVPDRKGFEQFFNSLGLKHFKPEEFLCLGDAHHDVGSPAYGLNHIPPAELWPNIVPTAKVLDELRSRLGSPVILNSVYRSPEYNEKIGGVSESQHMEFRAADFVVRSSSAPSDWAAVLKQMRAEGVFSGGIGVYNTFVHLDTRGENVDW